MPLMSEPLLRRCLTEVLGTAILVFAGTGAIVIDEISGGQVTHLGVGLTFGMTVAAVIYATGHISGAHINPAVTMGFALAKHFPWRDVPLYWGAQLVGAAIGSAGLLALFGQTGDMGATTPAGSATQSLGLELALTFILMFVIMAVATDQRAVGQGAAIAIGTTVGLEAIFAGPIGGVWASHWVYWLGPMAGAVAGAVVYRWIQGRNGLMRGERG